MGKLVNRNIEKQNRRLMKVRPFSSRDSAYSAGMYYREMDYQEKVMVTEFLGNRFESEYVPSRYKNCTSATKYFDIAFEVSANRCFKLSRKVNAISLESTLGIIPSVQIIYIARMRTYC